VTADLILLCILAGLILLSIVSVGARSLRSFSRHELEELARRRGNLERFGQILRSHNITAQAAENLLVVLSTLLIVASAYWILLHRQWLEGDVATAFVIDAAVLALALSAITVWIPWSVARLWAEPFLFYSWPLWELLRRVMLPFTWCGKLIDIITHRLAGRTPEVPNGDTLEEEIRSIVSEGHREGLLEEDAREMIEGVIQLGDADVAEIMTPRTDMHMLHVETPWDEMLSNVIEVGHTRIPVYDKNRDDIIGVLYSKDLLPILAGRERQTPPLRKILRKPHFVPESKAVDDLLEEFQQKRNHMAVVLDEYGGVAGLVTIEDVLEEIVGEIVDEYDEELVEEIKRIDESTIEALGRAHVDQINEMLNIDLPDDADFDTIAGFVFSELGRIPTSGESLDWDQKIRITVLEATPRRIERLRVEFIDEKASESVRG